MRDHRTVGSQGITERRKARARLVCLPLIGLICPPLAGVRSAPVWVLYVLLMTAYALWTLRLIHRFGTDKRLGYLFSLTDAAVVLPLLVWGPSLALRFVLVLLCALGFAATVAGSRDRVASEVLSGARADRRGDRSPHPPFTEGPVYNAEAGLERAIGNRLRAFSSTREKFGLVMLRVLRFDEIGALCGSDEAGRILAAVGHRGLRLVGSDAELFTLPGGRVALLFATGTPVVPGSRMEAADLWIDPYDVETLAMNVGRRACEHLIDGQKVECVVGWASAPADGVTPDDLIYAAESGAQSTAAFRRVAGSSVPVPEKTRAAAGW